MRTSLVVVLTWISSIVGSVPATAKGQDDSRGKPVTVQETGPPTTESGLGRGQAEQSTKNSHGQTVGQDEVLPEKLVHLGNKRLGPERIVHPRDVVAWAVTALRPSDRPRGARSPGPFPHPPSAHTCRLRHVYRGCRVCSLPRTHRGGTRSASARPAARRGTGAGPRRPPPACAGPSMSSLMSAARPAWHPARPDRVRHTTALGRPGRGRTPGACASVVPPPAVPEHVIRPVRKDFHV